MREQSWVTLATSDTNAWQALVLAKSLRRSFTTRKLTIAITESVSAPMRLFLQKEFDMVVRYDDSELELFNNGTTTAKNLMKLWLWNMKAWGKCVFVDPNCIILQNVDELFEYEEFSACPKGDMQGFSSDLFVFKPCSTTFYNLMNKASQAKSGTEEDILNQNFKTLWAESPRKLIDTSIISTIDRVEDNAGSPLPGILRFTDLPWNMTTTTRSNDVKVLQKKWMSIFLHEILPEVNREQLEPVRKFLQASIESNNLPTSNGPAIALSDPNLGELRDAIAIVGMSCRFPGANNTEEFWKLLAAGTDPIRPFPTERPQGEKIGSYFEAGFLKCGVDEFDAKFFGISPREAPFVDPQQRIILEVIWESLENSNINPQTLKETNTAVFMGIWQQDYDRLLPNYGLTANDFHHRYLGNAFSATASRISYFLGLHGPNYSIESGCSSSSSGVHLACNSLRRGETSLAISSGVNLVLNVLNPLAGDDKDAVVLSKDFRCKTFDESADGFVRAEGCGAVVLKRYADARRDGDNILALIRGSALNNDGPGTSFGTPNAKAQERVFREALKNAGVTAPEVSYVEAHGTGTMVGDPTEMYAIGKVYSEGRKDTLLVSSVKTNIGHAEACAGIAGLIKTVLCLQNNAIPPHLHLKTLNPRIDLDSIPAKIPLELTEWKGDKRIASVSSFSMSGTNVHLVVQAPPKNDDFIGIDDERPQVVGISAKSEEALEVLYQKYMEFLEENPKATLNDIAYSTNTGRANLPHRIAVVAKDRSNLLTKLKTKSYTTGRIPAQKQKVGFLFTGQGSQYFGMAKNLYNTFPVFTEALDRCEQQFEKYLGKSLKDVLWNDSALLDQTIYCQPAIFCIQYGLVQLWKYFKIEPDYVLGHSVGEFGAAVCAGILSLEDAMKLVVERSRLVNTLESGSMMAVKTSQDIVTSLIKTFVKEKNDWVDIAAVNSLEEVVVSGSSDSISKFGEFCLNNAVKSQTIPASHAFHSRHMDSVLEEFGKVASEVQINTPNCTYISGTLAKAMEVDEFGTQYWQRHLRDTVRFAEAIKLLWADCKILLEIGAQPILLGLAMGNVNEISSGYFCPSLRRNEEDWLAILTAISKLYVAGVDIDWTRWFGQRNKRVILPTYPFQRQKFWYVSEDSEFDGVQLNTQLLHPILGRQMPAPLSDTIFCNTLRLKDVPYIEDHKVAERIIVPGAAYLECIMSAGREVLQGGGVQIPMTVENLAVEAALELDKPCHIQTVVTSAHTEEGINYKISIHRQAAFDHADKWKRHSQAMFSPTTKIPDVADINIEELKSRLTLKDSVAPAYAKIADIGIQFGPKFQSIVTAWSGATEVLTEINLPDDADQYICHPIVLDAMIQTFAFRSALTSNTTEAELQLPVSIRKFVWLSKESSKKLYAHTSWLKDNGCVNLYSETGEQLAIMEGLELLKTSVDTFVRALNAEGLDLPSLYEEVWRPVMSNTRSRIDPSQLLDPDATTPNVASFLEVLNRDTELHESSCAQVDSTFLLFLMRAIQECNWSWPGVGGTITVAEWKAAVPQHLRVHKLVDWICRVLQDEGYVVESDTPDEFKIIKNLPSVTECDLEIKKNTRELESKYDQDILVEFMKRCGLHFTSVLQGKMSPLNYMFPDDPNEVGAHRFYNESPLYNKISTIATTGLLDCVSPLVGKRSGVIRILEVGAGSGKTTRDVLSQFSELGISVEYTFTDISTLFVAEARKKFDKSVNFGILNIEEDPLSQGFAPNHYDVILAMQVIHATADIKKALTNLRILLKPEGALIISEQFIPTYKISLSFGLLDGWWRSEDFRTYSPIVSSDVWKRCMMESGYRNCSSMSMYGGFTGAVMCRNTGDPIEYPISSKKKVWLLIGNDTELRRSLAAKLSEVNRSEICVNLTGSNSITNGNISVDPTKPEDFVDLLESTKEFLVEGVVFLWSDINDQLTPQECQPYFCQALLNFNKALYPYSQLQKSKPKLILVTRGIYYIGDAQAGNPCGATGWGSLRAFINEAPDFPISMVDTDQDMTDPTVEQEEIFALLWNRDKELFTAFREGKKFVQRTVNAERRVSPILLPNSDRFRLVNPPSHSLADVHVVAATKQEVDADKVEVRIHACALNFRDLFMLLQPEGFEIPKYMSLELGFDISGVISAVGPEVTRFQVGDEVIGFTNNGGLASHTIITEKLLMKKPANMTFTSAATVPVAFLTVFYSLNHLAKIDKNDRVLIHVATGGVGLAAIQVANLAGAEIYATAGSKKKRAYLRSIGIKHVYHSRNTEYGDGIARDTNGQGVTIVLNSLTGPNFKETSLNACAQGARFLEIGKMNIWTPEEVKALRPDVEYHVIDLAAMAYEQPEELQKYNACMNDTFQTGHYTGLPHDIFPLDLVKEAFHHFQEAKHIGKIVVKIPVAMNVEGRLKLHHNLFNTQSTYMITGGLGGIGMEVAKWMTTVGARNIVLVGRSAPHSKAQSLIDKLNTDGFNVKVLHGDVSKFGDCAALLNSIKTMDIPPLRGIMHAAGVIADATVPNQDWGKYTQTLGPKVYGGWNLHCLTTDYELEFFVMFSSISAIVGLPGQSNHAAANRYLDSLAHYRLSLGLPAQSINFGAWSEVGAAAHVKLGTEGALGIKAFTPKRGILAIEKVMRERNAQITILDVADWGVLRSFIKLGNYLDEIKSDDSTSATQLSEEQARIIEEIKSAAPEDRQEKIQNFLEVVLKQTLRLPDSEKIDPDQNFSELGVDSLMAMEMRNVLQGVLGDKTLTVSALQENRTTRSLSTHIAKLMNEDCVAETMPLDQMLALDSVLPEEITASPIGPCKPSEFKDILLTGATGHVGVHFIPELLTINPKLVIHCLLRGKSVDDAKDRLMSTFKKYQLDEKVNLDNIRIVVGDVSQANFGLEAEAYELLTSSIDSIVHCAIKNNHLESYSEGERSMRSQNVFGMLNVLRFAAAQKTKPVLYASSLVAVIKAEENGSLSEEYPDPENTGISINNGYALSKFISEKLAQQASDRGIPVTVLRYASIFGNSKTGYMPPGYNHAWNILLSCIRVRKFPSFDQNGVPIMPVDTAARISTELFLQDSSETGVYNLTNNSVATDEDIMAAFSAYGIDGEFVPYWEWRDIVFEEVDKNMLGPLGALYESEKDGSSPKFLKWHPLAGEVSDLNINQLSEKLKRNLPGIEDTIVPAKTLLERHLDWHFSNMTRAQK